MHSKRMPHVIIVCGRPHSGKTRLRELLSSLPDTIGGSCSDAIVSEMSLRSGLDPAQIYKDKEYYRPQLIALGDEMCATDPAALCRRVVLGGIGVVACGNFVLDGVRRAPELAAFRRELQVLRIRSTVVWLQRDGLKEDIQDNTTVTAEAADVVVHANEFEFEHLSASEQRYLAPALYACITQRWRWDLGPYSVVPQHYFHMQEMAA